MQQRKLGSCTTILVGKKATLDGATLIARNEDGSGDAANPQRFVVIDTKDQPTHYQAVQSGAKIDLPADPLRYTSTPDADPQYGIWGGAGINRANVAMTATETSTTNARILGIDPLVETGFGEEDFITITLPYSHSARAGVQRLGALLETYGTYESNGIAFADQDEVWYFETIGGHHWAAIKIPDDAYVIAPNRFNIADYDFEAENTLFSADLPRLIEQYRLNPDHDTVNLRHIFGSATLKDQHYNNPRAWYVQSILNPSRLQTPLDQDLPFALVPEQKISLETIKWLLSSHYQNTAYDPYGTGTPEQRHAFRPIGINRNQETHVLQIRPHVPPEIAGIHWLAYGPNTFNALVPFYANVSDTPSCYRDTTPQYDPTQVYWLSRTMGILGDHDYPRLNAFAADFDQQLTAACRQIQHTTDQQFSALKTPLTQLEQANQQMANLYVTQATQLLGQMVALSATQMKLKYNLND
ncbi:C69 family dipeptidase [Loigolactobacillus bifermentans]|uniref:Dipeptidase n=1 Tax=Loigolactobacillus bifermentans DSM 20003 TaxID=1423726 RepID=A0A0R1GZG3_9LACO|nr:C69 family dipeptidase [Loigolactobacillus bifermentans]KRK39605.1 Dipeptidase [Loigolactobacillus bifermentans DSM 20003]QGG60771.1 C69 family dipeptidase [Loigolactobacillus bifermentans]